ncbi:coagulation factor 5/8 type domain-containing protein [Diaporthe helianthi]|uniref:Coagulation factor 5/8 type domain-containing protein n=1 Tax=Diaporthe helianthi TaxID=158607 RepID=A0A2P5HI04_DIAHE|nr:coagulation factor 5/8 type domain-containing protein [Diaporthe helianthi]
MQYYSLARALLFQTLLCNVLAANIRSLFLFKDVLKSNTTAIKSSGFNHLIIYGVGVLENGDIMYYSSTPGSSDVLIASNGTYVGGTALSDMVKSFKTGTTDVTRVEISMNARNVKELVDTQGTGSSTRLYRNFAALKTAWGLDAVNNFDETIYDVVSTIVFGRMLESIGYKYSMTPRTDPGFWNMVRSQLNNGVAEPDNAEPDLLVDRVYLKCYDAGEGNDPNEWQGWLAMKVVPVVWVVNEAKGGNTPADAESAFKSWASKATLGGGGYWNDFDIEAEGSSYADYGNVLKNVFP